MKAIMYKSILLTVSLGLCIPLEARENVNDGQGHRMGNANSVLGSCAAGKTQTELKLNDVRTRILTDGDMWWDLTNPKYEIPKGSNSNAQYAGSLWFGGFHNGSLRVSAMTYRQNGIDFWPGPLDPATVGIDPSVCAEYDKHYIFLRSDVDNFYAYWAQHATADPATASWIKDYPGTYNYPGYNVNAPGQSLPMNYLAPYYDNNGDGIYNFADGDYPKYNVKGTPTNRGECVRRLFGDETIFWVFNDKGNKHTETTGASIGVEIRAQAFEFATGDELNQMSFYNYEVINWSTDKLDSTYFTVWDDCDLGNYQDDYIGCDVKRGLGYQYNGDNYDEDFGGFIGYHDKLPAIGCDFFQGPYADVGDKIDNDRDSCVDCTWRIGSNGKPDYTISDPDNVLPEQIVMSRFTYYTNTGDAQTGNPSTTGNGIQYYNFMSGKWKNGTPMTYGGNGTAAGTGCAFLFPGTTDPNGWGLGYQPAGGNGPHSPQVPAGSYGPTGWTQQQANVVKNDMRFLQSCGKFTLQPGAVNYVTYGIPFARSNSADNTAAIPLLQTADDKAQALFDNCFKVLDGPDAPDLTIQELSNQLLITISNNPYTSNNYEAKRYAEVDATIQPLASLGHTPDNQYRFEGYMIYQLKDETVGPSDLYNADKARLVFQSDVKNGVKQIINYTSDPTIGNALVPQLMVTGADAGIQNSLTLNADKFASSDPRMINFRNYYYMAISYSYNNFLTYVHDVSPTSILDTMPPHSAAHPGIKFTDPGTGDANGQKKPFLAGRRNIRVYTAIPHDPAPEAYGTTMNSSYGIGPQITRVEGQGNGGLPLDLTDASINDILNSPVNRAQKLTYVGNRGPLNVKVIDPLRVVKGDFTVKFVAATKVKIGTDSLWQYYNNPPLATPDNLDTGKVKNSKKMRWFMTGNYTDASGNTVTKTWLSDEGINLGQEKIMTGLNNELLGFSVTIKQTTDPNPCVRNFTLGGLTQYGSTDASDLLESSMTFANTNTPWLGSVADQDGSSFQDWILSGGDNGDVAGQKSPGKYYFGDASGIWEKVVGGTWAPWRMINMTLDDWSPGYTYSSVTLTQLNPNQYTDTRLLSSVDIVYTNDQSKWSHCPVIDMNTNIDPHTTIPYKWQLRRHKSVDKNGDTLAPGIDPVADSSMSWFPGYAINVETGERLSIMFAENSADKANRGNDMMWNPTANITKTVFDTVKHKNVTVAAHGGMHYIYVFGHNSDGNFNLTSSGEVMPSDVRRYDGGKSLYKMLTGFSIWPRSYAALGSGANKNAKWELLSEVFKDLMWVNMPLSANGTDIKKPSDIPCDVKVRIRVNKPYRYGLSTTTSVAHTSKSISTPSAIDLLYFNLPIDDGSAASIPADVVNNPQNGNFPMYSFNTNDLVPKNYDKNAAQNAMAKINIVPNPYYGHSAYEKTRIDNLIKIINLPVKCKIRIYTLAGTLIRTLEKDNDQTYLNWDLKNDKNVQIASGLYIIHIDAPGIGERILKWFGVMRPYDLQSY